MAINLIPLKMIGLPNLHLMNHKKQRAAQHKHVQVLSRSKTWERQDNTDSRRANPIETDEKPTNTKQTRKRRSFSRSYRVNCSFCIGFNDGNLWVYFYKYVDAGLQPLTRTIRSLFKCISQKDLLISKFFAVLEKQRH